MFALFAFGYLFGFVGLLIAVPLASAIGVLTRFGLARYMESTYYRGQRERAIARLIVREITERLAFLDNVGIGYLSLDRGAATLSGGEAQRIRLATQIGSSLVGVMYVLDEPSIGLHQRDNSKLIATLDHSQGDIADRLNAIYLYSRRTLGEARRQLRRVAMEDALQRRRERAAAPSGAGAVHIHEQGAALARRGSSRK